MTRVERGRERGLLGGGIWDRNRVGDLSPALTLHFVLKSPGVGSRGELEGRVLLHRVSEGRRMMFP